MPSLSTPFFLLPSFAGFGSFTFPLMPLPPQTRPPKPSHPLALALLTLPLLLQLLLHLDGHLFYCFILQRLQ